MTIWILNICSRKSTENQERSLSFFDNPFDEGDGYEIQALKADKGHYASYWDKEGGIIELSISNSYNIAISYEDNINTKNADREIDEDRLNDI